MLPFSSPILLWSPRTRMLKNSAILGKKGHKILFSVFHGFVRPKSFDLARKLGVYLSCKLIVNLWQRSSTFHKIYPYITWIAIHKNNEILISTHSFGRGWSPNIWIKSNGALEIELLLLNGSAWCFASLQDMQSTLFCLTWPKTPLVIKGCSWERQICPNLAVSYTHLTLPTKRIV